MFHTYLNVQSGEAVNLQQCINNSAGTLRVGLRSSTYTIGWYNVGLNEWFSWTEPVREIYVMNISPGLWSFNLLKENIKISTSGVELAVDKVNGMVMLTVPT